MENQITLPNSQTARVLEDENWSAITQFLPAGWEEMAKELNAYRRLRGVNSVDMLLRILMTHVGEGYSLVQTSNIVRQAGWAKLSDVAILKRLKNAEEWLRWMSLELARAQHPARIDFQKPQWLSEYRVRSFDATVISEPGSTGTDWRIHYSLGLFDLQCHDFVLTDPSGGEKVSNFTLSKQDVIVADRAYCNAKAIDELKQANAAFVLRLKPKSAGLFEPGPGSPAFDLLAHCRKVKQGTPQSFVLRTKDDHPVRLIIQKKSPEAAEAARHNYKYERKKKRNSINEQTVELHGYFMIVTSFTDLTITDQQLLDLYRLRWQIELAFKRLKTIMAFGHLPKYDPKSCRAWLYGKLLAAMLIETMVEHARLFSPWGYPFNPPVPP